MGAQEQLKVPFTPNSNAEPAFVIPYKPNDEFHFRPSTLTAETSAKEMLRQWESLTDRMEAVYCSAIREAQEQSYTLGKEEAEKHIYALRDALLAVLKSDPDDNMEEVDAAITVLRSVGVDDDQLAEITAP